jgi:hypothetical protein
MSIDELLASNETLGVVLMLVILVIGLRNRGFVREIAQDPDRFWRVIPRLALISTAIFIAWTSIFDNWRQLIGLPYRWSRQFPSQRVEYNPPSDDVRTITFVLLAVSLLFVACLVARHVGGVILQFVLFLAAITFWTPIFVVRQRFDLNLSLGFEGESTSPIDVIGYLLWVLMAWAVDILMIVLSYALLLPIVAVPVTILLQLFRLREPKTTREADSFFASFQERASESRRL